MKRCRAPDCDKKHKGCGYCDKHYQRYKRRGTVEGFAKREPHGMRRSPEYAAWCEAKRRCFDKSRPNYINYGGRGITICDEWRDSFLRFYYHIGLRPSVKHSLDRINNEGNYEPGNVRWATRREQALNRRKPEKYFRKPINNTSGFRGVYYYKPRGDWVVKIHAKGRVLHFGYYSDPKAAAKAYDKAAYNLFGEKALLNYPTL